MNKNKCVVYPVYISPYEGEYIVYIPDFNMNTSGTDLADAIFMARDAIGIMGIQLEDDKKDLPKSGSASYKCSENEIVTYVDVDLAEYRLKHDSRMVRKNCTIPYYLNVEAEKRGINFSRVLQEALFEKISCTM